MIAGTISLPTVPPLNQWKTSVWGNTARATTNRQQLVTLLKRSSPGQRNKNVYKNIDCPVLGSVGMRGHIRPMTTVWVVRSTLLRTAKALQHDPIFSERLPYGPSYPQSTRPPPGSVQSKRVCDAAAYRKTSGARNSDDARSITNTAFTTISYSHGGGSKLSGSKLSFCGEGGPGRPLKCHRCGSARIQLFTAAASTPSSAHSGNSPRSSTHGSRHRLARGGDGTAQNIGNRSLLTPPNLGADDVRDADLGTTRWTRTEETPSAVAPPQEVSGNAADGTGGAGVRRSRQNAAGLGAWKRRGRDRGERSSRRSGISDGEIQNVLEYS